MCVYWGLLILELKYLQGISRHCSEVPNERAMVHRRRDDCFMTDIIHKKTDLMPLVCSYFSCPKLILYLLKTNFYNNLIKNKYHNYHKLKRCEKFNLCFWIFERRIDYSYYLSSLDYLLQVYPVKLRNPHGTPNWNSPPNP